MSRAPRVVEQEDEGSKLVNVDEVKAERVQKDHKNLVLVSQRKGIDDQAFSNNQSKGGTKEKKYRLLG